METGQGKPSNNFSFQFVIHFKSEGQALPLVKPLTKFETFAIFWYTLLLMLFQFPDHDF